MQNQSKPNEFGQRVLQQFMELYINPEVSRRQEIGELPKPLDLRAAQIIIFSDGRKTLVRINEEIRAIAKVKYTQGISKTVGEPIFQHEIEGLEEINLTEDDDPDCGHATLIKINGRWTVAFDFRYNKALSKKHIETARQFCESAEFSFSQRSWAPFIDNLFSASELLAKCILLSLPDPKLRKKASHKAIQIKYNRFADLGNVDVVYRKTFNKLSGLRDQARYLKGDVSISEDEAYELLGIVKEMMEYTSNFVGSA